MTITEKKRANSKHQPVGRWIRVEKRLAVYLRDAFTCLYCGKDLHGADPRDVNLDHVVSRVDGGSNHESNIVTACRNCNCSRQDKPVTRFASPEALKQIRRNTKRDLRPFVKLAKAVLADQAGGPCE
jgi:5-methylcytosine-specific restriction endonuclease McrA